VFVFAAGTTCVSLSRLRGMR